MREIFKQSGSAPAAQRMGKHTYIDYVCVAQSLTEMPYFYPETPCIHLLLNPNSHCELRPIKDTRVYRVENQTKQCVV